MRCQPQLPGTPRIPARRASEGEHFPRLRVGLVWALLVVTSSGYAAPVPAAPATVKVAAVQCSSDLGDVAANTRKLTELVKEAARNGAKIVVLPETSITGYRSQDLKTNWHRKGSPIEK